MKYRIVHVRWHDSCLESEEWEPRREAIKLARTTKDQLIDSVGIVIDDNRYALVMGIIDLSPSPHNANP